MIADWIEEFITTHARPGTETGKAYRTKLNQLMRHLNGKRLTPRSLATFRAELIGRVAPHSARSIIATVRHFLKWCHDTRKINRDYHNLIKLPRVPPLQPKAIRAETVTKMIAAIDRVGEAWEQDRNRALIYLLIDTNARISELLAIEMSGIDLKRKRIETRGKGDRPAVLFISPATCAAIRRWITSRREREPTTDRIFISNSGSALSRSGSRHVLRRVAAAAGIQGERYNAHAFRHAWAREFLMSGGNLAECSQLMRHSSIWVTHEYYARYAVDELQESHRKYSPGRKLK